jgi:hypothetical protein
MTDFADGVEKVRIAVLGYGPQVQEHKSLLNASDDRRITLPQGPGQGPFGI